LAQTQIEAVRRYLQDAIAAETSFESQLQSFAHEGGDDFEVQALFFGHAAETHRRIERLTARLEELGGDPSGGKSFLARLFSFTPKLAQVTHLPEEQLVQNLIAAFSVVNSKLAMYEALAATAQSAGDGLTEALAREAAAEETANAEKIWRFLPSRSKIAFNLLTAGEIDPAVETKVGENRILDDNLPQV
jgi:ferritin-like metal-binding protein YciE